MNCVSSQSRLICECRFFSGLFRQLLFVFRMESRADHSKAAKSVGASIFVPVNDEEFWATHPCGALMLENMLVLVAVVF